MLDDLNSVAKSSEKNGGSSKGSYPSRSFQNFVADVGALDFGFSGPKFTWSNRRVGWANMREQLDRGLCNIDWQSLFPNARIRHLIAHNSNHNPIVLDTHLDLSKGPKPFRFKGMWVRDESSKEVVRHAWDIQVDGSHHYRFAKKFHRVQKDLIVWNKYSFGLIRSKIRDLEEKLKVVQVLDPTQENLSLEAAIQIELNEWLERDEVKWCKKSKELWLKEGDRNSKFFHLSTVVQWRKNQIAEIQLEKGNWIHSRNEIADYFTQNFSSVFQSSNPHILADLEGLIDPSITEAKNALLSRIPKVDEIKKVV